MIRTNLSPKPQLASQTLLQHIIWKLHSVVTTGSTVRNRLTHYLFHYAKNRILTSAQLVHQACATFWIFTTVETVKLSRYEVQFFISIIKLGKVCSIRPL